MTGNINATHHARRAHLALVGGPGTAPAAAAGAESIGRTTPIARVRTGGTNATGYTASTGEARRSRHESGVRAVAQRYSDFQEALLPMVLASGVSGESAVAVAEAISASPTLTAQAERAFQRARMHGA